MKERDNSIVRPVDLHITIRCSCPSGANSDIIFLTIDDISCESVRQQI